MHRPCGLLDTSSEEAIKESLQEIMAEMSEEEQERFKKTLAGIYMLGALGSLGGGDAVDIKDRINARN